MVIIVFVEDTLLKNEGNLQPAGPKIAIKLHFPSSLHSLLQEFWASSCNICIPPMPCLASQTSGPPSSTQGQPLWEAHPAASPGHPSTSTSRIHPSSLSSGQVRGAVSRGQHCPRTAITMGAIALPLARVPGGMQGAWTCPSSCGGT